MYNILKKIGQIFYKRKYINDCCITRVLCFRFKSKSKKDFSKQIEHSNLVPCGKDIKEMFLYSPRIPKVGKNTYSALNLTVHSKDTIIGAFCSIGTDVVLGNGDHPHNFLSTSPNFYFSNITWKNKDMPAHDEYWVAKPITVGNDVWIGDHVRVKNGVNIGDGAIIGMGAIVTKNIPPYAIVAGVPAKIIKYRFDEKTIEELLELKWWELDDEIIKQIPYDNIEKAIKFLKEVRNK